MIWFIFSYVMTKQKLLIYLLSLIVVSLLSLYFLALGDSLNDHYLYLDEYQFNYEHMMIEMLSFVLPVFFVMISMHHEQKAFEPLYAYFGRMKIMFYKILSYVLFFIWTGFIIWILIDTIPYIFTSYYQRTPDFLNTYLMTYLSQFIILGLVFLTIGQKHQSMALIYVMLSVIYHMFLQDNFSVIYYYICPFFQINMLQYTYHITYQILYIVLLFGIAYVKMLKKEII